MSTLCPRCNNPIPTATIEGLRKLLVSASLAFACPSCGERLMLDYTHLRTNLFRILYILGAVVLVAVIRVCEVGFAPAAILVVSYILGGWFVLRRVRKVVALVRTA